MPPPGVTAPRQAAGASPAGDAAAVVGVAAASAVASPSGDVAAAVVAAAAARTSVGGALCGPCICDAR
eukprot:350855-Chlamydomonas_euryale.AAC.2